MSSRKLDTAVQKNVFLKKGVQTGVRSARTGAPCRRGLWATGKQNAPKGQRPQPSSFTKVQSREPSNSLASSEDTARLPTPGCTAALCMMDTTNHQST